MAFTNKRLKDFIDDYCHDDTIGLCIVKCRDDGNIQSHLSQDIVDKDDDEANNIIAYNVHELAWNTTAAAWNQAIGRNGPYWDDLPKEKKDELFKKTFVGVLDVCRSAVNELFSQEENDD